MAREGKNASAQGGGKRERESLLVSFARLRPGF